MIVDLVHQGITGIKGYCNEPYLQACASPSILFSRYTQGWTLAESYYAASNMVGWEDIVVGDPILRAYPITGVVGVKNSAPSFNDGMIPSVRQTNDRMVFSIPMLRGFSHPTISISTLQGQVVKMLRSQDAGSTDRLVWDLNEGARAQIGPGIYLYQISISNHGKTISFQGRFAVSR